MNVKKIGHSCVVIENLGYFIDETLYHPGDSLSLPNEKVEVLALPVAAPWQKISETLEFAKTVNPKKCFPIHDGMLKIDGPFYSLTSKSFTRKWN